MPGKLSLSRASEDSRLSCWPRPRSSDRARCARGPRDVRAASPWKSRREALPLATRCFGAHWRAGIR